MEVPRQVLGIKAFDGDHVMGFNFGGQRLHWTNEGAFNSFFSHADSIGQSASSGSEDIFYSQWNMVFKLNCVSKQIEKIESSHKNNITQMTSNSWAVFTSCGDKHICRYEKNVEVQKETLPTHVM